MRRTAKTALSPLLKRLKTYFDLLKKTTSDYLYVVDREQQIAMVSPNIVQDFAIPAETMRFSDFRQAWRNIMHPTEWLRVTEFFDNVLTGQQTEGNVEFRAKTKKGEYEWLECRCAAAPDADDKNALYVGTFRLMRQQTRADVVTGLLNRYHLERRLKEALEEARKKSTGAALIILGIDNFKMVNAAYNRSVGDQVLREVARRIQTIITSDVELYKLDGDEFGIIYPQATQEDVEKLYKKIQTALLKPQQINEYKYFCTVSGGTVFFPQFGKDYLVLNKYAEAALAFAKQDGKNNNMTFSKELYNRWLRSLTVREKIRKSVEDGCRGFSLCFQPQVGADDHRLIGAEALLRWQNPQGRMVAPMEFVSILEETQLMIPVGKWIADTAVRICRKWQKVVPNFRMSINLSYVQLRDPSFKDTVKDCIERHGVDPTSIVLELTENMLISDWNFVNREFSNLRRYGLKIAMDDFGTGCSSLAMFKNLTCDIVKIDRAFVRQILSSDFDRRLVEYTTALSHSMGMSVCIEGVETEEEYDLLTKICKVDSIQGYLFGRPETQEGFEEKFLSYANNMRRSNYGAHGK